MAAAGAKFAIAIVGGGTTGIALALALLKKNVEVRVYEKLASLDDVDASLLLTPSALRAARICSDDLYQAIEEVASSAWGTDSCDQTFEYLDGIHQPHDPRQDADSLFISTHVPEMALVNRHHLLKAMASRLPPDCILFNKGLSSISTDSTAVGQESVKLSFEDETETFVNAVIGCDGVDSRTREFVLGCANAEITPHFAGQHSYQAQASLEDVERASGERRARTASVYMGYGKSFSMLADREKRVVHLTAICSDPNGSKDKDVTELSAGNNEITTEFQEWVASVRQLAALFDSNARRWPIYDVADKFPTTFVKGRVCLAGAAAHAMAPHLGSGTGAAIEDVVVLAEVIADRRVTGPKYLEAVFRAYEQVRRPRTQWLVQASRKAGALHHWNDEGVGNDIPECQRQLAGLHDKAWNFNVSISIAEAKQELGRLARRPDSRPLEGGMSAARQPYAEMLGVYDYVEQAFNSSED